MPEPHLTRTPTWRQRLFGFVALARLSNSPTVVTNVLAGASLGGASALGWETCLLAGAMVCFYTAGMYLNDLFDYEIDARERPDRPLPSGLISRPAALAVAAGLVVAGAGLLWRVGTAAFWSGLVLVAVIVVYDAWHKTNPLSPLLMALTRGLVYVTAYLGFAPSVGSPRLYAACGLLLAYVIGLTYIAKSETRPSFSRYWPVALLALPGLFFLFALPPGRAWLLVAAFAAWVGYSVRYVYAGRIGAGIVRLIAGISLLDALVLAWSGATGLVVVALAAFFLTLVLQRYIQGT